MLYIGQYPQSFSYHKGTNYSGYYLKWLTTYKTKKQLYISLVHSQVLYCSQLWWSQLLQDIQSLENIQHRATKFILNNYSLPYKSWLHLLPLMYIYELNDLMFFVKSLQSPHSNFDVRQFVQFARNNTRLPQHIN